MRYIALALLLATTARAVPASKQALFEQYHTQKSTNGFRNITEVNEQPVIGVISQSLETEMQGDTRFGEYGSYIM